jgi:hypothetical protein
MRSWRSLGLLFKLDPKVFGIKAQKEGINSNKQLKNRGHDIPFTPRTLGAEAKASSL